MKKKYNGKYQASLNKRGYEQVEGLNYYGARITSPVANDMSICIVMVLKLMAGWITKILDAKGEFLHG